MCKCKECSNKEMELLPEFEGIFGNEFVSLYPEMEFEVKPTNVSKNSLPYFKWVQESLNKILGLNLLVDGDIGPKSRSAIRSFQSKNKLGVDGKVGAITEAALIKAGATSPPGTHIPVSPPTNTCSNKVDITSAFRKFLVDAPNIVSASSKIPAAIKARITAMINAIVSVENSVDITMYTVFSCSKIYAPSLAAMGFTIRAQINPSNKEIWLSDLIWQSVNDFIITEDLYFLSDFFSTIAHEKRHATLGSSIQVNISALNSGQISPAAMDAQYRVEEILANAEEILVSKRIMDVYVVSISMQQMLRQHWLQVQVIVNTLEAQRLRDIIIKELRKRYGFPNNCDTAITVGILMAMETGKLHACYSGKIHQKIPSGLNLCKKANGDYQICP